MSKRRIVESSKLIEAVETGQLDKKIISKFGLENARSKSRSERAVRRRGRGVYNQKRLAASENEKLIKINPRSSLIVPRELVEGLGYNEGDLFYVRKTKSGIHLKKA
ncbi:MAG: hypothetical protein JRG97_14545 [Deltaproteobacteria bacterium]|nr:hypothetical protein [Deltaproteobacteria bacterium]MBW2053671.1 hypothetical protein [Deltaproteobacteria bacterium]MBW2142261.1 hypothetical protein [Deltaproteobacteria bacterium]MBW2324365.1 hypothetical protein [Deltaproteobacteria bacterium]